MLTNENPNDNEEIAAAIAQGHVRALVAAMRSSHNPTPSNKTVTSSAGRVAIRDPYRAKQSFHNHRRNTSLPSGYGITQEMLDRARGKA